VPEIVTGVDTPTAPVETANVALLDPAETVTLPGTVAAPGLLLDSETVAPAAGAADDKLMMPWAADPP